MVSAMSEKDIKDAFCVIDIDGDGTITLDELRYILTNMSTVESFSGNENQFHYNTILMVKTMA